MPAPKREHDFPMSGGNEKALGGAKNEEEIGRGPKIRKKVVGREEKVEKRKKKAIEETKKDVWSGDLGRGTRRETRK